LGVSAAVIQQGTPAQRLGPVETRDAQGVVTRFYALHDGALEVRERVVEQDDPPLTTRIRYPIKALLGLVGEPA
jgi:hypothetical protein